MDENTQEELIEEETMIAFGDAVKATELDDGSVKLGGYLIRYGDPSDTDLTKQFFTKSTNYGDAEQSIGWFNHRMPLPGKENTIVYKERLKNPVKMTRDEIGIFAEVITDAHNKYEQILAQKAKMGEIAWSSGTAPHLISGKKHSNGSIEITQWPLGLDASLTPAPAEWRNIVVPLKSIEFTPLKVSEPTDAPVEETMRDSETPAAPIKSNLMENKKMEITEEKLNETVQNAVKSAVEALPQPEPVDVEAAVAAGVEQAMKKLPAIKDDVKVTKDAGDQPFATDGEFFMAVKNAALYPGNQDVRLASLKATGLSENVPADGGYLLQPQVSGGIIERMYETAQILPRVSSDTIGPNSNSMLYNAVDESSRADGSRWGGVLGYWTAEAGTITASRPTFRQMELKLKKVAALCYATDELLADATALESWLSRTVPEELRFQVESAIYRGNGVGKPLGIMNAPCLVSVTRIDANEIDQTDIANMWARRWAGVNDYVWLANPSIFPQLINLTIGNFPMLMPVSTGFQGDPAFSLYGRPFIESEYTYALGTTGDLMLASLSQYQTINKGGTQAASSIHVQFAAAETAFRFIYRVDGQPLWNSALTPYDAGNTLSPFVVLTSASA